MTNEERAERLAVASRRKSLSAVGLREMIAAALDEAEERGRQQGEQDAGAFLDKMLSAEDPQFASRIEALRADERRRVGEELLKAEPQPEWHRKCWCQVQDLVMSACLIRRICGLEEEEEE